MESHDQLSRANAFTLKTKKFCAQTSLAADFKSAMCSRSQLHAGQDPESVLRGLLCHMKAGAGSDLALFPLLLSPLQPPGLGARASSDPASTLHVRDPHPCAPFLSSRLMALYRHWAYVPNASSRPLAANSRFTLAALQSPFQQGPC